MAGLKALVETLWDGALQDPPAARRFLDRVDVEVDVLTQMVEELLELSRIESGQIPLRLGPTPAINLVIPPLERLRPQAERAELTVRTDRPLDLPPVLAEEERVQRVVTNLVHNAIKFTPKGGQITVSGSSLQFSAQKGARSGTAHAQLQGGAWDPELRSSSRSGDGEGLDAIPPGNWVLFAVQDTGAGIPDEDLPRIFERFYKADRARSGGGTGLGLTIAKHVVQAHGGTIWAESEEGKGSTFYFILPAA